MWESLIVAAALAVGASNSTVPAPSERLPLALRHVEFRSFQIPTCTLFSGNPAIVVRGSEFHLQRPTAPPSYPASR